LGQYVTGSLVNLMLIVGVMIGGLSSGLTVAAVSPVFAKVVFQIGPSELLIPFIIMGNIAFVVCWHFLGKRRYAAPMLVHGVAAIVAAVVKFATLYVGIIRIAIPLEILPEAMAATASIMFSFPQLFTALIGGGLAIAVLPLLKRALRREG